MTLGLNRHPAFSPTSEELVDEWHMRQLEPDRDAATTGGTLGERTNRAERMAWRTARLRWIEYVLCERAWSERAVEAR
jgi:hypothetical protein